MTQVGSFIFKGTPEEFIEIAGEIAKGWKRSDPNEIRNMNGLFYGAINVTEDSYFESVKRIPRKDGEIGYVSLLRSYPHRSIRIFDRAWNGIKEYKVEVHLRPLLRGDKQTSNVGIKLIKGDWPDIEERLDQLIQQLQLEGWLISEIKQNYPECSMQENPLVADKPMTPTEQQPAVAAPEESQPETQPTVEPVWLVNGKPVKPTELLDTLEKAGMDRLTNEWALALFAWKKVYKGKINHQYTVGDLGKLANVPVSTLYSLAKKI